jgi:hypothetical protein
VNLVSNGTPLTTLKHILNPISTVRYAMHGQCHTCVVLYYQKKGNAGLASAFSTFLPQN